MSVRGGQTSELPCTTAVGHGEWPHISHEESRRSQLCRHLVSASQPPEPERETSAACHLVSATSSWLVARGSLSEGRGAIISSAFWETVIP